MALPIVLSLLVPQFNYMVNSLFLSRLGPGYLGAAGICGVYYLVFASIGHGLNNGLQALISRRAGQDRVDEIGTLSVQSVYICLIMAAFGIAVTYFLAPLILEGQMEEGLYRQSMEFLRIRIWGLPFLYLYLMRNAILVGTNESRLLVWGTLAETLSNVVLDYGLIFGRLGMPTLGFNGAAYASIAAEAIGLLAVLAVVQSRGLASRLSLFSDWKIRPGQVRLVLTQSSPLIAQYVISIASWEYFFVLVSHHGRTALDVTQSMRVVIGVMGVFVWSFASTANTMVSNVIGQGRDDLVPGLVRRISGMSLLPAALISIPFLTAPSFFLGLMSPDPEFISEGVPVLRVVAIAMVLMSVAAIWLNAVTGTGNTRVNLMIEVFNVVVYAVYVYVVLESLRLPTYVGWMSEWVYWSGMFLLARRYLLSGKWKGRMV
jgi:putative MATE family efflux protein